MLDRFKWWIGCFLATSIGPAIKVFVLDDMEIQIKYFYRYLFNLIVLAGYTIIVERGRPKFMQVACEYLVGLIGDLIKWVFAFTSILINFGGPLLAIIGFFHWFWMSAKIGSFWMFVAGITPLAIITVPVGAWSLFFGIPDWVVNIFG